MTNTIDSLDCHDLDPVKMSQVEQYLRSLNRWLCVASVCNDARADIFALGCTPKESTQTEPASHSPKEKGIIVALRYRHYIENLSNSPSVMRRYDRSGVQQTTGFSSLWRTFFNKGIDVAQKSGNPSHPFYDLLSRYSRSQLDKYGSSLYVSLSRKIHDFPRDSTSELYLNIPVVHDILQALTPKVLDEDGNPDWDYERRRYTGPPPKLRTGPIGQDSTSSQVSDAEHTSVITSVPVRKSAKYSFEDMFAIGRMIAGKPNPIAPLAWKTSPASIHEQASQSARTPVQNRPRSQKPMRTPKEASTPKLELPPKPNSPSNLMSTLTPNPTLPSTPTSPPKLTTPSIPISLPPKPTPAPKSGFDWMLVSPQLRPATLQTASTRDQVSKINAAFNNEIAPIKAIMQKRRESESESESQSQLVAIQESSSPSESLTTQEMSQEQALSSKLVLPTLVSKPASTNERTLRAEAVPFITALKPDLVSSSKSATISIPLAKPGSKIELSPSEKPDLALPPPNSPLRPLSKADSMSTSSPLLISISPQTAKSRQWLALTAPPQRPSTPAPEIPPRPDPSITKSPWLELAAPQTLPSTPNSLSIPQSPPLSKPPHQFLELTPPPPYQSSQQPASSTSTPSQATGKPAQWLELTPAPPFPRRAVAMESTSRSQRDFESSGWLVLTPPLPLPPPLPAQRSGQQNMATQWLVLTAP
ncbi:MAG: hypothetical protein Q9227_004691 [Pyrenula ochraceoflavens]